MSCILRMSGTDFDVDAFIAQSPAHWNWDIAWYKGETALANVFRIHDDSGVQVFAFADPSNAPTEPTGEALQFLKMNHDALAKLREFPGLEEARLDFYFEESDSIKSLEHFPPQLLQLAESLNLRIGITLLEN
ncbi:hypothetical protein EON80_16940 [bacterium]|nr:MAG: hypothetical protein EON80_16940 [bacterium]